MCLGTVNLTFLSFIVALKQTQTDAHGWPFITNRRLSHKGVYGDLGSYNLLMEIFAIIAICQNMSNKYL